jgi:hypothetical protein
MAFLCFLMSIDGVHADQSKVVAILESTSRVSTGWHHSTDDSSGISAPNCPYHEVSKRLNFPVI